jgi:hypothetical protein
MHAVYNARITLLATAFNNIGVGAIIAGVIGPAVSGHATDIGHLAAWFAFSADVIAFAQGLLGRLRS